MPDPMLMIVADCLDKAAQWLLDHPEQHITGVLSTSEDGHCVLPTDPAATCFCALGRAYRECHDEGIEHSDDYMTQPRRYTIIAHNDKIGKDYGIMALRGLASDLRRSNR